MPSQRAELSLQIDGLEAARNFIDCRVAESDDRRESLWVLHFTRDARCVRVTRHVGDECGAEFPLRSIIADVATHGSAGIMLAHNHPSGDSRPSHADCRATRRLACAAEAMGCKVLDHLIYAGGKVSSFRQLGLL